MSITPYQFGSCAEALIDYSASANNVVSFSDAVARLGLTEITADAGNVVSIADYISATEAATATATTGETATIVGATEISIVDGTATATAVGAGADSCFALGLTPKTAIIMAAGAALGLTVGFDLGRDLIDKLFFNDEAFDWSEDSIGAKVITWIAPDGTTYVSEDLLERIKNQFLNNGAFSNSRLINHDGTWSGVAVPTFDIKDCAKVALGIMRDTLSLMDPDSAALISSKISSDEFIDSHDWSHFVNFNGVGFVNFSISWDQAFYSMVETYQFVRTDTNIVTGTIDENGGHISIGNYSGWSQWLYLSGYSDTAISGQSLNITEQLQWNNGVKVGDVWATRPSMSITITNIGDMNRAYIPKQQGATYPSQDPLPTTYPSWLPNTLPEIPNYTDDDPDSKTKIAPLKLPEPNPELDPNKENRPEPDLQPDAQTGTNPLPDILPITDPVIDTLPEPDPNPDPDPEPPVPEDPIGTTPTITPPTSGSNTGLVKLYNPTLTNLASFSHWLWSNNLFDNFSKLFQDPMEAIIGLNLLYATPTVQGVDNIIVGNLVSTVPSPIIVDQYIHIDCGTVHVRKYFNNALDYINTRIQIYLPFIGIKDLDASDCMDRDMNVSVTVDVLTGTCLYNIRIDNRLLYTFEGNCAVQLPLTSANYSSVIASGIAAIGGVVATGVAAGATGGAVLPLVAASGIRSASSFVGNMSHSVERSGSITSNAGAMGVKKPYLIIVRNRTYDPEFYNRFYGYPANTTVLLGDKYVKGYTKVKDIHLEIKSATQQELNEIETLLKGGVIL